MKKRKKKRISVSEINFMELRWGLRAALHYLAGVEQNFARLPYCFGYWSYFLCRKYCFACFSSPLSLLLFFAWFRRGFFCFLSILHVNIIFSVFILFGRAILRWNVAFVSVPFVQGLSFHFTTWALPKHFYLWFYWRSCSLTFF